MKEDKNISIKEAKMIYFCLPDYISPDKVENFEFDIKPFESMVDTEKKEVKFSSLIYILAIEKGESLNQEFVVEARSEITFSFDGLAEESIDPETEEHLASVAYSTIRGMIAGYTRGTSFHKAYLPLIINSELIKNEESITAEKHEIETPNPPM